jgi:hypothetical protein
MMVMKGERGGGTKTREDRSPHREAVTWTYPWQSSEACLAVEAACR